MNAIVETARRLVRGKGQNVEDLRAEIERAEQQLQVAIAAAAQVHAKHDGQVLDLLGRGDDAGLTQSRALAAAADERVTDLQTALNALREKLTAAEAHAEQQATQRKQLSAEAKAEQLVSLTAEMQTQFDAAVATLLELVALNEDLYASLPARREIRPMCTTGHALRHRVQVYLFGKSNGLLCQQGMSAHVASEKPDLVAMAKEVAAVLLARKVAA